MRDYRLYCVDGAGKFTRVYEIDAVNDAEALMKARELNLPIKCELWERGRKVTVLAPHYGN